MFEDCLIFQTTYLFEGHSSKCSFAEGSFNQKPQASGEIRGSIWRHFVMKLPSKNVKNHENLRFHNSVRPDPAAPGPRKLRVVFPVISVLSKPPQLPYGATTIIVGGFRLRLFVLPGQCARFWKVVQFPVFFFGVICWKINLFDSS